MEKDNKKNLILDIMIIIAVAIIVAIPLFNTEFNIYRDDGVQHVCRIIGNVQSIKEGNVFPVIMSKFCNNFGYSWNLFYSPITAYFPILLKIFLSSYTLTLKVFMVLISIFTGLFMYKFVYRVTNNSKIATLAAVIYILAPYRLTDMYIRMAVAELASFMFLPLVFLGLFNTINNKEKDASFFDYDLVIGASGLVLSHIVIAMYTAIFCTVYIIFNIKNVNIKAIKKIVNSGIIIILLTSFYWGPLLEHKNAVDYEVFKEGRMERSDTLIKKKLNAYRLLYTKKNETLVFNIGTITLAAIALTPLAIKKIDKLYKKMYYIFLAFGIASLIMSLKIFPFEKLPEFLKMLQFSFRMLEFSAFFLSVISAINLGVLIKNIKRWNVLVIACILIILSLIPLKTHIAYTSKNSIIEEKLINAIPVTSETKRVHAGCASFEYLPCKAFENRGYIETREDKVYVLEGKCNIKNEEKNGTKLNFEIENYNNENVVLELPYIYYLGYEVNCKDADGVFKLKTTESDKGFVKIEIPKDKGNIHVSVSYNGTKLMQATYAISYVMLIFLLVYKIFISFKKKTLLLEVAGKVNKNSKE